MDLDGKKYFEKNEKGEIMLEGMIVIIITLFILIWILAVGINMSLRVACSSYASFTFINLAFTTCPCSIALLSIFLYLNGTINKCLIKHTIGVNGIPNVIPHIIPTIIFNLISALIYFLLLNFKLI